MTSQTPYAWSPWTPLIYSGDDRVECGRLRFRLQTRSANGFVNAQPTVRRTGQSHRSASCTYLEHLQLDGSSRDRMRSAILCCETPARCSRRSKSGCLCLAGAETIWSGRCPRRSTLRLDRRRQPSQECEELALGTALIRLDSRAVQGVGNLNAAASALPVQRRRIARHGLELWNCHDIASRSGVDVSCFFAAHTIQVKGARACRCER